MIRAASSVHNENSMSLTKDEKHVVTDVFLNAYFSESPLRVNSLEMQDRNGC